MFRIVENNQRLIEKDLFALPVLHAVIQVLVSISLIPVKARHFWVFFHHMHNVYAFNILVKSNLDPHPMDYDGIERRSRLAGRGEERTRERSRIRAGKAGASAAVSWPVSLDRWNFFQFLLSLSSLPIGEKFLLMERRSLDNQAHHARRQPT